MRCGSCEYLAVQLVTSSPRSLSTSCCSRCVPSQVPGWSVRFGAMKSAYAEATGSEPAFTNYAWSDWDKEGPFQETLDYIFVSANVACEGVKPLPATKDEVRLQSPSGFPTKAEPSDHVLIAADLLF